MIRGSAISALLHGSLLALLLFGLPHLMFLTEDDPIPENPSEPPVIEVATITPEQAAAIDKAAARALPDTATEGGRRSLLADAINTETDPDGRNKLQSAAASNAVAQSADSQRDEQTSAAEQSPRDAVDAQSAVEASRTAQASERSDGENAAQQAAPPRAARESSSAVAASQPQASSSPADARVAAEPNVSQAARDPSDASEPRTARLPQPADQAETPLSIALVPQAAVPAAASASVATLSPVPDRPPPSGAVILASGDGVARSLEPLVALLPRLDETVADIVAAQARSPAEAAEAAQAAPAFLQSIRRMESAAEQGYAHAQFSLAEIFLSGNGQPRDVEKGRQYLQRASLNGYLPAQLLSAALAAEGSVVPRDAAEAHAWLAAAAEQGSKPAREALQRLEQQMTPRDELRARQRRNQLRQVFVLSNPKPDSRIERPQREDQLRVATTLGDVEAVYLLLSQGSDANKPDGDGRTAAIEASWRGYGKILGALLEQGADIRAADGSGKTALMWAAINGHAAVAERLLAAEAAIDAQDGEGMTALMRAAWNGHADTVRLLLQKRANPNLRDRAGKTALDYATQARQSETVRLLQYPSKS